MKFYIAFALLCIIPLSMFAEEISSELIFEQFELMTKAYTYPEKVDTALENKEYKTARNIMLNYYLVYSKVKTTLSNALNENPELYKSVQLEAEENGVSLYDFMIQAQNILVYYMDCIGMYQAGYDEARNE